MIKKFILIVFIALAFAPTKSVFAEPVNNSFSFTFKEQEFIVDPKLLDSWQGLQTIGPNPSLNPPSATFETYLQNFLGQPVPSQNFKLTYHYDLGKIYSYIQNLSNLINQKSREPALAIKDNRAAAFTPPQTGLEVEILKSSLGAVGALEMGKSTSELFTREIQPKNSLALTNSLGINELVAQGVSNFKGSPKNRRFNIAVGVEKMKGVLVAPGAEFSFDDNLGPVDGEHGFLPELVIKKEGTIPEFGGGLCQVSTTTFRAAMNGGLPITARRNHAYAVQYYYPQGTDATIYPGSADLKFINNTPGTILIWPYIKDTNTLIFDFYGTKDGRQVTLEKPVVYDRKPDGSMKAAWTREVFNNNATTTDTFKSVYQSPALFHHDLSFVPAAGVPPPGLQMPPAKTP